MRTAFAHVTKGKEGSSVSTKLSIDAKGLLKVTHVVSDLSGTSRQMHSAAANAGQQMWESQRNLNDGSQTGILGFLIMPMEDEASEE